MRAVVSATQLFERLRSVKVLDATWFLPNSPFAGAVVRRFGARNPLILGCGLWTYKDSVEHRCSRPPRY